MFDLSKIEYGVKERPFRMVLCGVEKIGKSTFAASAPTPLAIPIKGEEGVDSLDIPKTPIVRTFEDLMDIISAMYENKHDFKTLIIDSVSTMEPLIWDKVCQDHGKQKIEDIGYAKGYIDALYYWRDILEGLDALRNDKGMNSILIGHVNVKTFNDPLTDPYDQYIISMHYKTADLLYRWGDLILFANSKVYAKETKSGKNKGVLVGERKLFTQKRPSHPGGGRGVYGHIPYEMNLSWTEFETAVNEQKGE